MTLFRGREYFTYGNRRYDVQAKPFRTLLNQLRARGERPFDLIRIGNTLYALNANRTQTRTPLVKVDTRRDGSVSKRGETVLRKMRTQQYLDDEMAHDILRTNVVNVIDEHALELPAAQTLERREFTVNIRNMETVQEYFNDSQLITYLRGIFPRLGSVILRYSFGIGVMKPSRMEAVPYFMHSPRIELLSQNQMEEIIARLFVAFREELDKLPTQGSGLTFVSLKSVTVWVSRYTPPTGASYKPLPAAIAKKNACINVKNSDDKCLKWAVLSALFPASCHAGRTTKYASYWNAIDDSGVCYPASDRDVSRLEKQNSFGINLYGLCDDKAVLIRHTERTSNVINLLRFDDHYVWIKNFDRLMNQSGSEKHRKYFCTRCAVGFYTREKLTSHTENGCKPQFVKLPSPEKAVVEFRNIAKLLEHPYVIYADFESALVPGHARVLQQHTPIAYGYQTVCRGDASQNEFRMEVCDDAHVAFVQQLVRLAPSVNRVLTRNKPYHLTPTEASSFAQAERCYLCGDVFGADGKSKVVDHDHVTGAYRGPAHLQCNSLLRMPSVVPVLFHNFTGYDGQFVLNALCRGFHRQGWEIDGIATSGEKYKTISFSFPMGDGKFTYRFMDSMAFLNSSLDALAANLDDSRKHFTRTAFPALHRFALMKKKGFLPYDMITSLQSLEAKELPKFENLKPVLGEVKREHYDNGVNVWNEFRCANMREYLLHYLSADVRLLADVFEEFRSMSIRDYRLDPVHYVSLPAMAWDALLLKTQMKLDLVTEENSDMFNMIERGKRGGVCFIGHRHAFANNFHSETYDASKRTTWLQYLDANNLYGWAMSQPLPVGGFEWTTMTAEELLRVDAFGDCGYFVECDLSYPASLHIPHHLLPLAPENVTITPDDHSPYQQRYNVKSNSQKLVTTLRDKKYYVLHIRNFQQYVKLGMTCSAVHRVLKFKQSPWMKPFIDLNTAKRAQACNDFEKDFYKLMNNSVFGKTMENVRDRIDSVFVHADDLHRLQKVVQKPTYTGHFYDVEDTRIMIMNKATVKLDKPIAVGVAILDISKTLMYDFHYRVMLPRYGVERLRLCMTDTDSLLYWVATDDVYTDMREMGEHFDMSEFPVAHANYNPRNKKVLGKFKDEEADDVITEFVGLRAKLYAYRTASACEAKRAKGVKRDVIKTMKFQEYVSVLAAGNHATTDMMMRTMRGIRSIKHRLQTLETTKIALSAYDDKRYLLDDGTFSVPHGFCGNLDDLWRIFNLWRTL
ncbi:hypothetical protein EBZ38_13490 [bacterium]|nr:hypothetical protein [bacterium]